MGTPRELPVQTKEREGHFDHMRESVLDRTRGEITRLLERWSDGDREALARLMPLVYGELQLLAESYLRRERPDHTFQTSDLVNEAYLRLVDQDRMRWQNRAQFFGIAAQAMRRILVDHARTHHSVKRGGRIRKFSLDKAMMLSADRAPEFLALDDALISLSQIDQPLVQIVELRFFGGLTGEEIAQVLGISASTVARGWRTARAWLYRHLTPTDAAQLWKETVE